MTQPGVNGVYSLKPHSKRAGGSAPRYCVLFLLKDEAGRAILIAQAVSKSAADEYGRTHIPRFCGESIELDPRSGAEAEEFWGVRTVRVSGNPGTTAVKTKPIPASFSFKQVWIHGLELPDDVEEDGLLTPEDRRELALDHISRTSDYVVKIEIVKRSRG